MYIYKCRCPELDIALSYLNEDDSKELSEGSSSEDEGDKEEEESNEAMQLENDG